VDSKKIPTAPQLRVLDGLSVTVTPEGVPTDILERPDLNVFWHIECDLRWGRLGWQKATLDALVRRGWAERDEGRGWVRITAEGIEVLRVVRAVAPEAA